MKTRTLTRPVAFDRVTAPGFRECDPGGRKGLVESPIASERHLGPMSREVASRPASSLSRSLAESAPSATRS
jgi:hypothetical protein